MTTPPRSSFVNVLAWIFIALAGFSTLIALLQAAFVYLLFPGGIQEPTVAKGGARLPWYFLMMFQNLLAFVLGFVAVSMATLVSSIGLLRRWNWARLLFVGMMGVGILWNAAGTVFSFMIFADMPLPPPSANKFAANFSLMTNLMLAVNVLATIAFAVLFGWIIKRLLSPEIRSEFS